MQSQRVSHKRAVQKICFSKLQNTWVFHFSSFWLLLLSNLITFIFLIHFKRFKVPLGAHHLKFHKLSLHSNRKQSNKFLDVWESAFVVFGGLLGPAPAGTGTIGFNFWKLYLIRTNFTLDEPIFLVKLFKPFKLEWIFLMFRLWPQ
jgi:hypothetical protein